MTLLVAPAGNEAIRHAVTHWHYSRSMPLGRRVSFGVWEDGRFVGTVIFSRGASRNLGVPYGLTQTQVCELTRIALRDHAAPVSQIIAASLRRLKRGNPGLRLVVSFADPGRGHHGGIYQAGNWIYTGTSKASRLFRIHGTLVHERCIGSTGTTVTYKEEFSRMRQSLTWLRSHADPAAEEIRVPPKHRYLYPLDRGMRRQIAPLARPYPAAEESIATRHSPAVEGQVQPLPAAL